MFLWMVLLLLSERILFLERHHVHHTVKTPIAVSTACHVQSQSLSCLQEPSTICHTVTAHLVCHLFNLGPLQKQGPVLNLPPVHSRLHRGKAPSQCSPITLHPYNKVLYILQLAAPGCAQETSGKEITWVCFPPVGEAFNFSDSPFAYLRMVMTTPVLPQQSVVMIKR